MLDTHAARCAGHAHEIIFGSCMWTLHHDITSSTWTFRGENIRVTVYFFFDGKYTLSASQYHTFGLFLSHLCTPVLAMVMQRTPMSPHLFGGGYGIAYSFVLTLLRPLMGIPEEFFYKKNSYIYAFFLFCLVVFFVLHFASFLALLVSIHPQLTTYLQPWPPTAFSITFTGSLLIFYTYVHRISI